MLELTSHEVVCPVCKRVFFPETAVKGVLCGEELYPHTDKLARALDCQIHYFCSKHVTSAFKRKSPQKKISPELFLEKIGKANFKHVSRGFGCHDIQ